MNRHDNRSGRRRSGPLADDQTTATHELPGDTAGPSGHVKHDERGNAVWEWFKQSTSRLLRKLELPDANTEQRRGGSRGYDPYNQHRAPRKPRK